MGLVVKIVCPVRTPMQSGAKSFRSSTEFFRIANIASTFHNVDFSACWPFAILIVPGEQPNSRPKPISFRQLGPHLHSAVGKMECLSSGDFGTHDGVNIVVAIRESGTAVEIVAGALVDNAASPHVIIVPVPHIVGTNFVLSQHGFDVKGSVLDEGSRPVIVIELELPVASTAHGDVMLPLGEIERGEIVLEDQFGLHCCQAQNQDNQYHLVGDHKLDT